MKVVLLSTSDHNGGAAIACVRLQKALTNSGIEATVLVQEKKTAHSNVLAIGEGKWYNLKKWARFIKERLHYLPYEANKEVRFLFNPGFTGIDLSRDPYIQQADIIHLHWTTFGFLSTTSIQQLLALGKQVVWTFHDMWAFTGGCHHSGECEHYQVACGNCQFMKSPHENDLSHRVWEAKKKAYTLPFIGVGCSQWLANRARKSSLLANYRIESIPNPLDTTLYSPCSKSDARSALGLEPNKEYILFAAMRIDAPKKGYAYFQAALALLAKLYPELTESVELLIMGHADTTEFDQLPFPVHMLGYKANPIDMIQVYNAASLFVTPSLEENLPNTIMEAMACGTPSVGFEVGGIPEMITHKVNGFVATFQSEDSLAEGIHWVLNANKDGHLSTAAREKVQSDYKEEVVAKQYVALYESALV